MQKTGHFGLWKWKIPHRFPQGLLYHIFTVLRLMWVYTKYISSHTVILGECTRGVKKTCYTTWSSNYLVYYINGFQMIENTKSKPTL